MLQAARRRCPGQLLSTIVAGPAGRLADRFGHRAVIVPGTLFFAAGVMVLRSAGAEPDWLGLWLPGAALTGIGIGLAFPTLGSAAVRDVRRRPLRHRQRGQRRFPPGRRRARHGDPRRHRRRPALLAEALSVSDDAYLFAVFASLVAGAATLGLRPLAAPSEEPAAEAGLAPAATHSG